MVRPYSEYKQIDDIIDDQKKLGQYNVRNRESNPINYRYPYSSAAATSDKFDDVAMHPNEGDFIPSSSDPKGTDSEITIVRVRCDGLTCKRRPSKWTMNDIAVPGDGSHLGESPSLVNLATLVQQNDEYLVPLSSWDPYYSENSPNSDEDSEETNNTVISAESKQSSNNRPQSITGRISTFLRRHCKKSKTLPEPKAENK